jgi:F-type H+-transporting ATPase subunit b
MNRRPLLTQFAFLVALIFSTFPAWAQEHGGAEPGGAVEIPWNNIGVQAFNLVLLLGLLVYLLRHSLRQHFAQRASEYKELVDRAENAAKEAEQTNKQIKEKLAQLSVSAKQSEARAEQEAVALRERMAQEAKAITAKMEHEARHTALVELEKAKDELRRELLEQALHGSREKLLKSLGSSDQQKLQNEFAQKIELVSR